MQDCDDYTTGVFGIIWLVSEPGDGRLLRLLLLSNQRKALMQAGVETRRPEGQESKSTRAAIHTVEDRNPA